MLKKTGAFLFIQSHYVNVQLVFDYPAACHSSSRVNCMQMLEIEMFTHVL